MPFVPAARASKRKVPPVVWRGGANAVRDSARSQTPEESRQLESAEPCDLLASLRARARPDVERRQRTDGSVDERVDPVAARIVSPGRQVRKRDGACELRPRRCGQLKPAQLEHLALDPA